MTESITNELREKELYERLEMEVIVFEMEDVITTSPNRIDTTTPEIGHP